MYTSDALFLRYFCYCGKVLHSVNGSCHWAWSKCLSRHVYCSQHSIIMDSMNIIEGIFGLFFCFGCLVWLLFCSWNIIIYSISLFQYKSCFAQLRPKQLLLKESITASVSGNVVMQYFVCYVWYIFSMIRTRDDHDFISCNSHIACVIK